jgi:hypothetical protein
MPKAPTARTLFIGRVNLVPHHRAAGQGKWGGATKNWLVKINQHSLPVQL